MKNSLPIQPMARKPRAIVKINDAIVVGWIEITVTSATYNAADTFSATFAVKRLEPANDLNWFTQQKDVFCEILIGFVESDDQPLNVEDMQSMILGRIDEVNVDLPNMTVEVHGRDLTALLMDTKTTETYIDALGSDVVADLVSRHPMLNPVITASPVVSGLTYLGDHMTMHQERAEWDIITDLAKIDGYQVYAKGADLIYEPVPDAPSDPYVFKWEWEDAENPHRLNAKGLRMHRDLKVSRGIQVVVKSWNTKPKLKVESSFGDGGAGGGGENIVTHKFVRPNLDQDAADGWAKAKYEVLKKNEMKVSIDMHGDNDLVRGDAIEVQGTGTAFDQLYFVSSIARQLSFNGGYSMSVEAKNRQE